MRASWLLACTFLLACGGLPSCAHKPPAPPPADAISKAADGLAVAALGLRLGATAADDWRACVALASLGALADGASIGLRNEAAAPAYPAFSLDLSRCSGLPDPKGTDLPDLTAPLAASLLRLADTYVSDATLPCEARARISGAFGYLTTNVPAIVAEVEDPDWVFAVKQYPVDLSGC